MDNLVQGRRVLEGSVVYGSRDSLSLLVLEKNFLVSTIVQVNIRAFNHLSFKIPGSHKTYRLMRVWNEA